MRFIIKRTINVKAYCLLPLVVLTNGNVALAPTQLTFVFHWPKEVEVVAGLTGTSPLAFGEDDYLNG